MFSQEDESSAQAHFTMLVSVSSRRGSFSRPILVSLKSLSCRSESSNKSLVKWAWAELSSSWLNLGLTAAIVYLLYKILFQKEQEAPSPPEPPKPPVKKQDMTLQAPLSPQSP